MFYFLYYNIFSRIKKASRTNMVIRTNRFPVPAVKVKMKIDPFDEAKRLQS